MTDDPQAGDAPDPEDPLGAAFGGLNLPFDLSQFDMAEAMRILSSPGPLNWEIARQVATQVAHEDGGHERVSPATEAELLDAVRGVTGPVASLTGAGELLTTPVEILDRDRWVQRHLDGLRPVLETLAETMQGALAADLDEADDEEVEAMTAGLGLPVGAGGLRGLMSMLGPLLLGAQTGSMIGYLAQYALGAFDLPLPVEGPPVVTLVAPNVDAFAREWSLETPAVRTAVAVNESVRVAQRLRPWVRERILSMAREYVGAFELDPRSFEDAFGEVDPTDPETMAQLAQRPDVLLDALRGETQRRILERNQQLMMVLEGYADLVGAQIAEHLVPDADRVLEALRRHQVERGQAGRFVEGMLGIELDRDHYERGRTFCGGVLDRAGTEGLNRLWDGPEMLPTPNELDAPGLWLARIDLPGS